MGRQNSGGIRHAARPIEADLMERCPWMRKEHRAGISDLVACSLQTRSANTAEWKVVLPRTTANEASKEKYIHRVLANKRIDPKKIIAAFMPQIMKHACRNGKKLILMMDQSKVRDGFEVLMLSVRVGQRAIPLMCTVKQTEGPIGFDDQKTLLETFLAALPEKISVLLAADRFYGTASLIEWCQQQGWDYRLRMKSNLVLVHEGKRLTTGEAAAQGMASLERVELNETGVRTNIGILHEAGHEEPWIIAMSQKPSAMRVLDYGMRWGIEPMFSDFKSRGCDLTLTHLKHADRIERLILILALGMMWCISVGMAPETERGSKKKRSRSALSFFQKGMRFFLNAIANLTKIPVLWFYASEVAW
jgi:Transposase DDE domain